MANKNNKNANADKKPTARHKQLQANYKFLKHSLFNHTNRQIP